MISAVCLNSSIPFVEVAPESTRHSWLSLEVRMRGGDYTKASRHLKSAAINSRLDGYASIVRIIT